MCSNFPGDIRTIIYNGKELRHYQYVDEIIVSEGDDELTEVNEDTIRVKNFESVTYDGEEMKYEILLSMFYFSSFFF